MTAAIPTLDLRKNYGRIREEIGKAIQSVLDSQQFIMGPDVGAFENECSAYLDGIPAIACASGTDALVLALMALGIKEGDEVITTPYRVHKITVREDF